VWCSRVPPMACERPGLVPVLGRVRVQVPRPSRRGRGGDLGRPGHLRVTVVISGPTTLLVTTCQQDHHAPALFELSPRHDRAHWALANGCGLRARKGHPPEQGPAVRLDTDASGGPTIDGSRPQTWPPVTETAAFTISHLTSFSPL